MYIPHTGIPVQHTAGYILRTKAKKQKPIELQETTTVTIARQ